MGLNFCISCGTKIKQVPIQPTSPESSVIVSGAPETCSGCGKSLAGSLSSCTSCGSTTDPSIEPGFGETSIEELDDSVPATSEAGIDWSGIWRTLFSENSMASILGFGILLITVGLLVVLIDQWQNEESRTWLVFLALAQTAAFIFIGHMVKERLKLYLSGLAFLSLGGVWAIYTAGIISYLLFDPVTEYQSGTTRMAGNNSDTITRVGVSCIQVPGPRAHSWDGLFSRVFSVSWNIERIR